jgi:4-hydroxyphenylpyruvate dioxygenase
VLEHIATTHPDEERMVAQLYELAERAGRRNLRIGFEALAWGRAVNLYSQAWAIVKRANHPHLGLIVDSFHTLSLRDDPAGIANIPGDKIFFMQLADAPLLVMDVLQWARHYRNFPGQGQFDIENFFEQVLLAGYTGPLSLEIFNDLFREVPNRRTAADAMRSLLYIEGQVRARLEGGQMTAAPMRTSARASSIVSSCSIRRRSRCSAGSRSSSSPPTMRPGAPWAPCSSSSGFGAQASIVPRK